MIIRSEGQKGSTGYKQTCERYVGHGKKYRQSIDTDQECWFNQIWLATNCYYEQFEIHTLVNLHDSQTKVSKAVVKRFRYIILSSTKMQKTKSFALIEAIFLLSLTQAALATVTSEYVALHPKNETFNSQHFAD